MRKIAATIAASYPAGQRFLRSAPHLEHVGAGQNVVSKCPLSNTDVPHTGHLKTDINHMFRGIPKVKARTPKTIE
jgi:hypothetical protein